MRVGRHQVTLGGHVLLRQPGDAGADTRRQPARAGLAVVLLWPVVGDPRHGWRPSDVVQQAREDEFTVFAPLLAGECRTLQRMLELVDRLAVVGEADHRTARGNDLLDGVLDHPHGSV
jgi:hypothetical protein